jgi:hypothetical protein
MRITLLILSLAVFATPSLAQQGAIPADPILSVSNAFAYRQRTDGRYDVLLGSLVAKVPSPPTINPTEICLMFGSWNPLTAPDPRKAPCLGTRLVQFLPNQKPNFNRPWVTLTNVGCAPSKITNGLGKGCEALHVFAVNSATNPPSYTRLTAPDGAPVFFSNPGQDSNDRTPPLISSVRYEPSSQVNSMSTQTTGFVRVLGTNFKLGKRYALLVDGVPYASATRLIVSNTPTMPKVGQPYIDFPGFSLPPGEFSVQLAEFIREPKGGDGVNRFANAIKPYTSAVAKLSVVRGTFGVTCSTTPEIGRSQALCFMQRGFLSGPVQVTPCTDTANNQVCIRNFPYNNSTIASVDLITRRTDAQIRYFSCRPIFGAMNCFAEVGAR